MAEGGAQSEELTRSVIGGSEVYYDFFCNLCNEDGDHVEAFGYCNDCSDYLCEDCYKSHCKPKPTRHHVLLDSEHMPKALSSTITDKPKDKCTETCSKHPNRVIEYYCHEHNTLACSVCAFADHRTCHNVDHIPDVASDIQSEVKDVEDQLQMLQGNTRRILQESKDNEKLSSTLYEDAIVSLRTYRGEICTALEIIETELEDQVNNIDADNKKRLQSATSKCGSTLVLIEGILKSISTLQNTKQCCNLFVAVKKAKDTLKAMHKELLDIKRDCRVAKPKLECNVQLRDMLIQSEGLGKISVLEEGTVDEDSSGKNAPDLSPNADREIVPTSTKQVSSYPDKDAKIRSDTTSDKGAIERKSVQLAEASSMSIIQTRSSISDQDEEKNVHLTAQLVASVNVKTETDIDMCWVTGLAVVMDDALVITDYRNNKIKVIDVHSQKLVDYLAVQSSPWGITVIEGDTIAVTFPHDSLIQYMQISKNGAVNIKKRITVNGSCYGISFSENMLWVTYKFPKARLEMLTLDGKVQLIVNNDILGQNILHDPHYVKMCPKRNCIYVSDYETKGVYRLSYTGKVLSSYTDDGMIPYGIALSADSTIYMCDGAGGGLFALNTHCEKMESFKTTTSLTTPRGLAYQESTRQLFVGRSNNEIHVYQLMNG